MRGFGRRNRLGAAEVIAAGMALVIAGCSSGVPPDESESMPAGTAHPGSDAAAEAGSVEANSPQPRLVVTDADSGRTSVIDLTTRETLATWDFGGPADVSTVNGRYAVAVDLAGGRVHVLDPGSWTVEHGDHGHSYIKDPAVIGELTGLTPGRVVAGDRKLAVFFDGTGTADVIEFDALNAGNASVRTVVGAGEAHHGVVAPLSDHFVASAGGSAERLPGRIELRTAANDLVRNLGECSNAQGEAVFSTHVVVACDDGVLRIDAASGDFVTRKIPYPASVAADNRPFSFAQTARGALVSAATTDGVLVLDTRSGAWAQADTSEAALATGMSTDRKTVFAVFADGTFRVFDAVTGAQISSTQVLPGRVDDSAAPAPAIVVGGARAYVSDPASKSVHEIDYRDNGRIVRSIEVAMTPSSIGVTGA